MFNIFERLLHLQRMISQIPATSPLQQCVGTGLAAMPATKRSACVAPEVDLGECTLYLPPQKKRIMQKPLWL